MTVSILSPTRSPSPTNDAYAGHLCDMAENHGTGTWSRDALSAIETDQRRSADTHLLRLGLPALQGIDVYLKDESTHPTGSLKHRLARSLFIFGICNGRIREGTPIVEASSGSTAISEAYFARVLGLPFHAVMPRRTSVEKIEAIEHLGGHCHFVEESGAIYREAERLAETLGGVYLDQFTNAERATDWRGNNNIAELIFDQMGRERFPIPSWIVMSAGTGGTTATLGRYIRYRGFDTKLCVPDPENSAFFDAYRERRNTVTCLQSSQIEGIGRPRVEPSFVPGVIDCMFKLPDSASIAGMRILSKLLGRKVGASTGTNFFATCLIARRMRSERKEGSIVTLICDGGERYQQTYYNAAWLKSRNIEPAPYEELLDDLLESKPSEPKALLCRTEEQGLSLVGEESNRY